MEKKIKFVICFAALFLFTISLSVYAEEYAAGRIVKTKGHVEIFSANKNIWEKSSSGKILYQNDIVKTGLDGRASILMEDETLIQINKNSKFVIENVVPRAGWNTIRKATTAIDKSIKSLYKAVEGEVWFRNKDKYTNLVVDTPVVVVGVRGTDFTVKIADDKTTTISLLEGIAEAYNEFGSISMNAGEEAVARPGQAPQKRILLRPVDAVQWTITVPPLIEPHKIRDLQLLKAYSALMDGNVRDAHTVLKEIVRVNPSASLPWSMLALSSLVLGDKKEAIAAAEKGVDLDQQSVTALIVLSYTCQSNFEFDRAMEITDKAYSLENTNPLVLTNLARLKFGAGYMDEAMKLIEKAESSSPGNAEIYNLKGFIALARQHTKESIIIFRKAIELDPTIGEPHMGLGLAYMRLNDVATALEEITTAVLLEPQRALFLSYWAKMLYQVDRHKQAIDILELSHRLDPNDPTPELYKSIVLRDLNRPTEAIKSLNNAVSLNDNRAIYRSKFLLDQDLAVKNIDLSRLYEQLGLSEWAKNKAMVSVKQDYNNSSAHLFLAGSVREDGDRSWIYLNETLLARLLMPANLNSFNTFNEYTSFFEQPAVNGTVSGTFGSFKSAAGELYLYGGVPHANLAFGVGTKYYDSDGWRRSNDEREANFAGIVKWDATPKDKFMFVASNYNSKQGDRWYPRYEYDSNPNYFSYSTNKLKRLELGYNRQFTPNSNLLIYLSSLTNNGTNYDNIFKDPTIAVYAPFLPVVFAYNKGDVSTEYEIPYKQVQIQYLHKMNSHQLIVGTNQYWGENTFDLLPWLNDTPTYTFAGFSLPARSTNITYQQSYYAQDTWRISRNVTLDGALYFDRMKDGGGNYSYQYFPNINLLPGFGTLFVNNPPYYQTEMKKDAWSPRLGLVFTPTKTDTLRLAGFQYMLPYLSSRLDPTNIAGIPIYRNATPGSIIKETSLFWEHDWPTGILSTNLFYLEKEYVYSVIHGINESVTRPHGYMRGFEANLNQLVWNGIGLNVGYRFRNIDEESLPQADREEHIAKAGVKYLHWSGFSCGAVQTYRHDYMKTKGKSNNDLWITDAYIGYELPGKRGQMKLEVKNIFNSHFNWVTNYYTLTGHIPEREIIGTLTVNF